MAWRQAFGRETFPKLTAWPPRCAPAQSGSTASTSSTPLYPSEATSNPAGAERWAKTSSNSTRRRKQSAHGCKLEDQHSRVRCKRMPRSNVAVRAWLGGGFLFGQSDSRQKGQHVPQHIKF